MPTIKVRKVKSPQIEAHHTQWAVCECNEFKDAFMLVLLNEDDEPVATACYDFQIWRDVFRELEAIRRDTVGDA